MLYVGTPANMKSRMFWMKAMKVTLNRKKMKPGTLPMMIFLEIVSR